MNGQGEVPAESAAHLTPGDAVRFDAGTEHVYQGHAARTRGVLLMIHPD